MSQAVASLFALNPIGQSVMILPADHEGWLRLVRLAHEDLGAKESAFLSGWQAADQGQRNVRTESAP